MRESINPDIIKSINFFSEFKEWYYKIIKDFNFDEQKDKLGRDLLLNILLDSQNYENFHQNLENIKNIIQKNKFITIFGCGPSLEKTFDKISQNSKSKFPINQLIIAIDGAAVFLDEKGIKSNLIFTDLDGFLPERFSYFRKLSNYIIIHAHGDNIDILKKISNEVKIANNIIGTTQVEPKSIILNPGGFTDGDRVLYFLKNFIRPNQKIFFIGMDFGEVVGRYSKPEYSENQKAKPIKLKKLQYAEKLLEWIIKKLKNEIYFINSKISSNYVQIISIKQYLNFFSAL